MATTASTETEWQTEARHPAWLTGADAARHRGARLLDLDPAIARGLDPALRARLAPALRVRLETLDCGPWSPDRRGAQGLGLLVVDGLLLRGLAVHGRSSAELLGPGDLLRPWHDADADAAGAPVPTEDGWQVVDGPARIAVLDDRAAAVLGRFPALVGELLDRTLMRARALQFQLALTQVHGIGQRLELLLWQFADRWGRVTPDGVVLPLGLTHEMLGRLIGARRPSVTTALRRLDEAGRVERRADGWLLRRPLSA